jgi:hypothetical protein
VLKRIAIIRICNKFNINLIIYTPGRMPSNGPYFSNNCALDRCDIQPNLGAITCSTNKPRLRNRCLRIHAFHREEDRESVSQEPSTFKPEAVQWMPLGPSQTAKPPPRLVKTRRGVPMFIAPIPDDRCLECNGNGKVTCGACRGKGRLNYRKAAMLPEGVWPEWCPHCRASGRWVCSACMGTGERREPMGFRIE